MPLNRTLGEEIGDLGRTFEIMPTEIYANTKEFATACEHAKDKFKDAAAIEQPIRFYPDDVLVQYYPKHLPPLLVFIFCKKCKGGHDSDDGPRREDMPVERFVTFEYSVVGSPEAMA